MIKKQHYSIVTISVILIVFFILFYVLHIGASLIIPFIIALLFSFAIIGLSNFYRKLGLWTVFSFLLSLGTYVFVFWLIGKMIGSNIESFIVLLPDYQEKVLVIIKDIFEFFRLPELTSVNALLEKINLQYIFNSVIGAVTSIFSSMGIILFYVIFILLEFRFFKNKLELMIIDRKRKTEVFGLIEKIKKDIKSYFVIKTGVSFITAILSFCVMTIFGLDFAVFWAFLIFLLNFIPSIGSVIAVMFPAFLSLIQFGASYTSLFMIGFLIGVQVLMGNIIEPRFVGNKLNLSPLVIILSLGFWGSIWGVVGMLLAVPIMVIINIILAKIPSTRSIAVLLSEKGELQVENHIEFDKTGKQIVKKLKEKFHRK